MLQDEEKRRKSIAYILRRRKRGRKIGANSGELVKSWAEYSEVNFRPSAAQTVWWRWLLPVIVPLMMLAPFLIISWSQGAQDVVDRGVPIEVWILISILGLIGGLVVIFASAYIGLTLWRSVRSFRAHKNE